jgi:transposase
MITPEELKALPQSVQDHLKSLEMDNEILREKLRLALYRKFGRSSEKLDPSQLEFFAEQEEKSEDSEEPETIAVAGHTKKKPGRKPLSDNLPRQEIIHDISQEEKTCACGSELSKIDETVSERLQIIPEQIYVEKHIRPKYACRNCEGSGDEEKPVFRQAPAAPSLLPGSIMTPGLLAFILVNKYCDHLPFYRQEVRFKRIGAQISRQNMSNWMIKAYEVLKTLEDLFHKKIKEGPVIQMDETTLQVMKEPNRENNQKSYMWLARGGPVETPLVIYRYHETRHSRHAQEFLEGYSGYLQTDGYRAYETALKDNGSITHVGCLAHARRKFNEAALGSKKKSGSANIALRMIREIYRVESMLREQDLSHDDFLAMRRAHVMPLLDNFKSWLDDKALKIRPVSHMGKAVAYTLGQWDKIIRYLDSPYLTPDNNGAERAVKPFVVGRKNWLFSGSPVGADASCFFFSLIETAKQNDLEPYWYLKWVFERAARMGDDIKPEELLPWNMDRELVGKPL